LPSTLAEGINSVSVIDQDDEFTSWYRCAYYENELVLADRVSPEVVEEVTATSGIVFSIGTLADLKGYLPFGIGRVEVWLESFLSTDKVRLSPFNRPLVGFKYIKDYLGLKPLFMLHPTIVARCGLQPAQQPGPLTLIDGTGDPVCIFRRWSVRALGRSIGEETPRLSGCDLIVRPDIFERITHMSKSSPVYVTTIAKAAVKLD
jgi:hypothetical protein